MKGAVCLLMGALFSAMSLGVIAQGVGDKRVEVAGKRLDNQPSSARFAIGLTRDEGITFRDQARATDAIASLR